MNGYQGPARHLVSQEDQSLIERPDVPRSRFKQSWSHKKTGDAGLLYPFCVIEVLPGDHIKLTAHPFVRTATPLFPIMDSQRIDTHFFFVPNRLVWANWRRFMGEQDSPSDSIAYTIPQVQSTAAGGFQVGGLGDHFGLPTVGQCTAQLFVNALPFRAYNLIYNQWFRDENLVTGAFTLNTDVAANESNYPIRRRAKSHDYFTSALPAPQKFTPPTIPVGGTAPVIGLGFTGAGAAAGPLAVVEATGSPASYDFYRLSNAAGNIAIKSDNGGAAPEPQVFADLSLATGISVNDFRQAMLIQQYLERDARGGTRYVERNLAHFGVRSPDMRLQRAEFLGGGSTPLQFTPIAQTAPTAGVPLGALGAAGTAAGRHSASYASTEDGFIIGLISVKTELSYSQGVHRMWSRSTRYDYYVPSLALLGEQAVLRKEIYATGVANDDNTVFGYQERWHEHRTRVSEVTGLFRSTAAGNIDEWHLSQQFTAPPVLGQTFIEDTPPMSRVLAAGALANGQQYLFDILIEMDAVRPLPMFGTPAMLGRF